MCCLLQKTHHYIDGLTGSLPCAVYTLGVIAQSPTHDPAEMEAALRPALSCLVLGEPGEHTDDACRRLRRSSRVGSVETLNDEIALGLDLAARRHDLVVVILPEPNAPLPRCLLKHPDVRVLVVAPDGVRGTLARWLQQGADDLVSPDDADAYDHALSRLLDACALAATARRQAVVIDVQRQRIESMIARSTLSVSAVPKKRRDRDASLNQLRRKEPPRIVAAPQRTEQHGERDGLPGRQATMKRLLALASRPATHRTAAAAIQVTLPFAQCGRRSSQLDCTLADLAVYRAADALRCYAPKRLLVGRLRINRLVLLVETRDARRVEPTQLEASIRSQLATLGGLLGSADEIDIDIEKATLANLAVPSLIDRLEGRYDERMARQQSANNDATSDDTLVPTVTNRVSPDRLPLVAARS